MKKNAFSPYVPRIRCRSEVNRLGTLFAELHSNCPACSYSTSPPFRQEMKSSFWRVEEWVCQGISSRVSLCLLCLWERSSPAVLHSIRPSSGPLPTEFLGSMSTGGWSSSSGYPGLPASKSSLHVIISDRHHLLWDQSQELPWWLISRAL